MIIKAVEDVLYVITALGVGITLWYVIPRPWRRTRQRT